MIVLVIFQSFLMFLTLKKIKKPKMAAGTENNILLFV